MRIVRFVSVILIAWLCLSVNGQTQNGYVKTKGRMAANGAIIPGKRLSGATIQIKGRTPVLSSSAGTFTFPIPAKKFFLQDVKKIGFVLADMEILSRQYTYSTNPLVLVMEDKAQVEAERRAIERKKRNNLYAIIQKRSEEIEALKEKNKITEEKYHQLLQKLNKDQDENESIIRSMTERYMKLDFDEIDDFYRQVSYCILNGELLKADSLLRTRGDITAQIQDIKKQGLAIQESEKRLQQAKTAHTANIDEAARRCYSYYETCFAQHKNDSALHYLKLRTLIDTTNVTFLSEVASFLSQYMADYEEALKYYKRALSTAKKSLEATPESIVNCLMDIAKLYGVQFNAQESIKEYQEALLVARECYGDNHPVVAKCLMGIATSLANSGQREKALDYLRNALSLLNDYYHDDSFHSEIADCYNMMGVTYNQLGRYDDAVKVHEKALEIRQHLTGYDRINSEISLHNIGMVYINQGKWDMAINFFTKSWKEKISNHGEDNCMVTSDLIAMGQAYCYSKNFDKALECYNQSLVILNTIYGNNHPAVALCYSEIGMMYLDQKQMELAVSNFKKSVMINTQIYGGDHLMVGLDYNNIGYAYIQKHNYEDAINIYNKALLILSKHYPPSSSVISNINKNLEYAKRKLKEE